MTRPRGRTFAPSEDRVRRHEIEHVFAEAGLLGKPRNTGPAAEERFARRLRNALTRLGPTFSELGLYLASRADLLPACDCLELAGLPDRGEPMPASEVQALIAAELGKAPRDLFAAFDAQPLESRLFTQEHAARLPTGDAVVVRLLRPGVEERVASDLALLERIGGAFACGDSLFSPGVIADFQTSLSRRLDLAAEAEGLELLALDAEAGGPLLVPRVERNLSTPCLLVREQLRGARSGEARRDSEDLARQLCLAWLSQALRGRTFPVEPRGANLEILPGNRIAFTGGLFAKTSAVSQVNVASYLVAVAARRDPDEVCSRLLREMTREGWSTSEERLRLRLRQAVPFRDGGWNTPGEDLAEYLFLNWRLARECGYRPSMQLTALFRGLSTVSITALQLAPDRDALQKAFDDFRFAASISQLVEMAAIDRLAENLERYAALMVQLPELIDQALTLAAAGPPRSAQAQSARRQVAGSPVPLIAALLGLAATALLAWQLGGGVWQQRLGALVFFGAGALLLRWVGTS
jgi:ubiquinone biosynthesis protein